MQTYCMTAIIRTTAACCFAVWQVLPRELTTVIIIMTSFFFIMYLVSAWCRVAVYIGVGYRPFPGGAHAYAIVMAEYPAALFFRLRQHMQYRRRQSDCLRPTISSTLFVCGLNLQ